jgi:hypothetical protein
VKELKAGDYICKYYNHTKQNRLFIVEESRSKCFYKCILLDYNENKFKPEILDTIKIKKDKDYIKLKDEYKKGCRSLEIKHLYNIYYE